MIMRDQVGGNLRGTTIHSFEVFAIINSISGNNHVKIMSPKMHGVSWMLTGITKDSTGAVLGGCTVHLFYSLPDQFISAVDSDPTTGAFSFLIGPTSGPFYLVAYKAGSPDVAGTTVNTLMPVAT